MKNKSIIVIISTLFLTLILMIIVFYLKDSNKATEEILNSPSLEEAYNSPSILIQEHTKGTKKSVRCLFSTLTGMKCYDLDMKRIPYHCDDEFVLTGTGDSLNCKEPLTCDITKAYDDSNMELIKNSEGLKCPEICPYLQKTGEYYEGSCSIINYLSEDCVFTIASAYRYYKCSESPGN
ncbi:MAG: hypothetical protein AABW89_02110 [Nanoarchaeota archaeon]